MKKPCLEFILACACCAELAKYTEELAKDYPEVETKVYTAGNDTDYIEKYGALTKSLLVVNEEKAYRRLSRAVVKEAFEEALRRGEE